MWRVAALSGEGLSLNLHRETCNLRLNANTSAFCSGEGAKSKENLLEV